MLIYDFIDKVQHCRIKKNDKIKNIDRVRPILRFQSIFPFWITNKYLKHLKYFDFSLFLHTYPHLHTILRLMWCMNKDFWTRSHDEYYSLNSVLNIAYCVLSNIWNERCFSKMCWFLCAALNHDLNGSKNKYQIHWYHFIRESGLHCW